jgi:hypothetical protein
MQWIPIQMHLFHESARSIPMRAVSGVSGGAHNGLLQDNPAKRADQSALYATNRPLRALLDYFVKVNNGGPYNGRPQRWSLQAARKGKESEESMLWL